MLILRIGYFYLGGIFLLEKILFLTKRLGSKDSNIYLTSYNIKLIEENL